MVVPQRAMYGWLAHILQMLLLKKVAMDPSISFWGWSVTRWVWVIFGSTDAGPTDAFGAVLTSGYDASILATGPY